MSTYLKLLSAIVIWGFALSLTKKALLEISPVTLITLRCFIGWFALACFARFKNSLSGLSARDIWRLFIISASGIWFHQLVQAFALAHTSANHAGWLVAAAPLVTAGLMRYAFKEKLGKLVSAGFGLGFMGGMMVFLSAQHVSGAGIVPTSLGDVVFIASMFSWAFYSIYCGRWFGHMPFAELVRATMAVSALAMLPIFLMSGSAAQLKTMSPSSWIAVLYLGLLSSAFGYYIWNLGVEKLGPSRASAFLYLEPLTAVLGGMILLGEQPSAVAACGGLLILSGVYWINGGRAGAGVLKKVYSFLTMS